MKWIVFDVWGVVYTECESVDNVLTPFVRRYVPSLAREQIRDAYRRASVGDLSAREFWTRLGLGDRYPQIQEEMLDSAHILDEHFIPIAEQLKGRYSLALLSNDLTEWSEGLRRRFGIDRFFQVTVISDEARSRKPDHGIYKTFLQRAEISGAECLFIDDRLRNLKGAAEVGLRTCWFDRTGLPDADFVPDVQIQSLLELPEAIERTWQVG